MKRTRRGTTEASLTRPNRQRPTASTRRQRAAPQDHFEDTTEVEDVVPTHDSNADAEVEDVAATQDSNVEMSGLEHLIRCSYRNADKIVVSTFVERWHPETNTFHMPFGEMAITLSSWLRPCQVYQVVETLQQILEGTNIRSTMTYQRHHG
ncbi:unnamed protein product [Prunus armeniaca]